MSLDVEVGTRQEVPVLGTVDSDSDAVAGGRYDIIETSISST